MSQVYSAAYSAVQGTNKYFSAPESENFIAKGGRVFSRAVANAALAVASLIEVVVYALLSAAALPLCISTRTKRAFSWAYAHTAAAAKVTTCAVIGIAGRMQVAQPTEVEGDKAENPEGRSGVITEQMQVAQPTEVAGRSDKKDLITISWVLFPTLVTTSQSSRIFCRAAPNNAKLSDVALSGWSPVAFCHLQ